MKPSVIVTIILAIGNSSFGNDGRQIQVPNCTKTPDFLVSQKVEIAGGFKDLPKMIFVGREAHYYVEGKDKFEKSFRLYQTQSFKNPMSRLVCANYNSQDSISFSFYAPTLIDLNQTKTIGDTFWQFQVTASLKDYGVWNHQSKIIKSEPTLEDRMRQMGVNYKIYQTYFNEYIIIYSRKKGSSIEHLAVIYDAVSEIQ